MAVFRDGLARSEDLAAANAEALAAQIRRLATVMAATAANTADAESRAAATAATVQTLAGAADRIGEAVRLI
ncbi:hypothetical protein J8J27_31525, partial [Mycobacterium tuberculosis]|nr:hypothetical protein [Mycobacterium tuberculosis]